MGTILLEVSIGRDLGALKGLRMVKEEPRHAEKKMRQKGLPLSLHASTPGAFRSDPPRVSMPTPGAFRSHLGVVPKAPRRPRSRGLNHDYVVATLSSLGACPMDVTVRHLASCTVLA